MNRRIFAILATVGLSGCTAYDPMQGSSAPMAWIDDSYASTGGSAVNFFVVTKVDGHAVENSIQTTSMLSSGMGAGMRPMAKVHQVPSKPIVLTLTGQTHYSMPIMGLVNKTYEVSGDVAFTPQAGETYVIKGELGDSGSSVWVEDLFGHIQSNKVTSPAAAK